MKYYFYRGRTPNFGDELNNWLLPKVFPNFFDDDDSVLFLGIGSIIFDSHPKDTPKIVFGTGYGGYTAMPALDDSWKFYCVRGPRTADICGLSRDYVAGDAAILINRYRPKPAQSPNRISFMPHFQSIGRGHWQAACRLAGIHFIDPRHPVEQVLDEIQASTLLISEAMHGVIVADALRVPWIGTKPFDPTHLMKWFDWGEALGVNVTHTPIPPSSVQEAWLAKHGEVSETIRDAKGLRKLSIKAIDAAMVARTALGLRKLAAQEPNLSADSELERVIDRLETDAGRILKDYR